MDRPMTTEELFDQIQDRLKEKGRLPDILDYGLATHSPVRGLLYQNFGILDFLYQEWLTREDCVFDE